MNKRLMISIMAMVMGMSMGGTVLASELQEVNKVAIESTQKAVEGFMTEVGQVCTITERDNGYELQVGDENGTIFYLKKDIRVFDVASGTFKKVGDLKKDMTVSVVYPKDAPMMLSLPARCSAAQVVIIHSETANLEVGYFNDELVNEENTLALNIADSTIIKSITDDKKSLKVENIRNKDLMVIYENTTRSIPAQTTPKMVFVLDGEENDVEVNTEEIEEAEYVAVRNLATENGFKVVWDKQKQAVTLTKEGVEIVLTVGKREYKYNKEVKTLQYPIKLENGYVKIADKIIG